ncbi:MAG TPA: SDR family oxidoreductase [Bacillales bacterium]|nr:SDR family oxidoreductase [Bacillales bacterium]
MKFEELRHKVVVVTGAGSGIGQSIALGFASQGATVAVTDLSKESAESTRAMIDEAEGGTAFALACDVSDESSVEKMVAETLQTAGHIDILVNSAGIVCKKTPTVEVSEADWELILSVNLKGTFLCSKHAGKVFIENRNGTIINIGSISAKIPRWRMAPYSASKAAVVQLTRVMAIEMAEYGVRVNTICPGGTVTPLMQTSMERDGKSSLDYRIHGDRHFFRAGIPLRRMAQPDDHVGAALFLASDAAKHITGQSLYIDGGESII